MVCWGGDSKAVAHAQSHYSAWVWLHVHVHLGVRRGSACRMSVSRRFLGEVGNLPRASPTTRLSSVFWVRCDHYVRETSTRGSIIDPIEAAHANNQSWNISDKCSSSSFSTSQHSGQHSRETFKLLHRELYVCAETQLKHWTFCWL